MPRRHIRLLLLTLFVAGAFVAPARAWAADHGTHRDDEFAFTATMFDKAPKISGPIAGSDDDIAVIAIKRVYAAKDAKERSAFIAAIQKLADAGNMAAAFRLGRYYHIEGAPRDLAKARELYDRAATAGNGWATSNLGLLYENGAGVARDVAAARKYYLKAANLGDEHGFSNLARLSFLGIGVPRDRAAGFRWLEAGTARGLADCAYDAATILYNGTYGVPPDHRQALLWFVRAGKLGHLESQWNFAKLVLEGDGVEANPQLGMKVLNDLVAEDYAKAANLLGEVYGFGRSVAIDKQKAVQFWMRAAQLRYCKSMDHLADAFDNGWGVPQNLGAAFAFNQLAVACADPPDGWSVWKLATRYRDGLGTTRSCATAVALLTRAVALHNSDALTDLGFLFENGCDEIKADSAAAFRLYLIGAKLGVVLCQNNVGAMLKHGALTGKPDHVKGYAWLSLAARNGSSIARSNLAELDGVLTASDRRAGEKHLAEISKMLADVKRDPQALARQDIY